MSLYAHDMTVCQLVSVCQCLYAVYNCFRGALKYSVAVKAQMKGGCWSADLALLLAQSSRHELVLQMGDPQPG